MIKPPLAPKLKKWKGQSGLDRLVIALHRNVIRLYGGVFEAHSCQCSADSYPQGEKENERFRKKQENRYENTFQAPDPVRDNKGWDKALYTSLL